MKANTIRTWADKEIFFIYCTCFCNAFYAKPAFTLGHFYCQLRWISAFKTNWRFWRLNCKWSVIWGIIWRFNYYLFCYSAIRTGDFISLIINDLITKLLSVFAFARSKLFCFNFWYLSIWFYFNIWRFCFIIFRYFWFNWYHFRD